MLTLLAPDQKAQLDRLIQLREALGKERDQGMSPAVERALYQADACLLVALGYFGHGDAFLSEN